MALLDPSEGEIRIDGIRLDDSGRADWQAQIAHVPQISLSRRQLDRGQHRLRRARRERSTRPRSRRRRARPSSTISLPALPEGYETSVGERGVRLSGGQRQRIAIARAFYKQANVLIFDEATGALDRKTERAIMESVAALGRDITVLIVAHRISALAGCDRIVRLEAGRIAESGSYEELVGETA